MVERPRRPEVKPEPSPLRQEYHVPQHTQAEYLLVIARGIARYYQETVYARR